MSDFIAVHIASGDQLVTDKEDIQITLRYPLKVPYIIKAHNKNGFNLAEFTKAILGGYKAAYAQAEKYQPWGHHYGELYLEGIEEESPGVFEIMVGS